MTDFAPRFRHLVSELDALGSAVDEGLKAAERVQVTVSDPGPHEQRIQKLGALSRIVWDAHKQMRKNGLPTATRLDAERL